MVSTERTGEIEIFKDTEIDFGDVWKNKIDDALEKTASHYFYK